MLMCLWALQDYQRWVTRLARPALRPLVRRAFEIFCGHRHAVSRLLGLEQTERALEQAIERTTTDSSSEPPLKGGPGCERSATELPEAGA